jgi:hypothetical protein
MFRQLFLLLLLLLMMMMIYFGLQEMLERPWKDRFRLPLSAQAALRYLSSSSCSSFCTTQTQQL